MLLLLLFLSMTLLLLQDPSELVCGGAAAEDQGSVVREGVYDLHGRARPLAAVLPALLLGHIRQGGLR